MDIVASSLPLNLDLLRTFLVYIFVWNSSFWFLKVEGGNSFVEAGETEETGFLELFIFPDITPICVGFNYDYIFLFGEKFFYF